MHRYFASIWNTGTYCSGRWNDQTREGTACENALHRNGIGVAYSNVNEGCKTKSTERFTGRAAEYVLGRPSYPELAIDAIFNGRGDPVLLTVVDLGAGTGISSRLLASRGASVIAIEPNHAMRETAEPTAGPLWHAGTAEDTGLLSTSVDIVTAFQAFHWFTYERALNEMRRILRASGRAAAVYNDRDDSDTFTATYSAIVRRYATDVTDPTARKSIDGRAAFATYPGWKNVWNVEIENDQTLERPALHARAISTSYLPKDGQAAETLHAELDAVFSEHATNDRVTMRMKTTVTIAE